MGQSEQEKENAAKAAVEYIKDGMLVGLGSGSTSAFMVRFLGDRIAEGLSVRAVPSSDKTEALARSRNIPLTNLDEVGRLDIYIDGADEVDDHFNMIKGGGGALLREKILAHNSKLRIIIVDSSKGVKKLGAFRLPIEIVPFACNQIIGQLEKMGLKPVLRKNMGRNYITDEKNFILDVDITEIQDYQSLNDALLAIPGVVETGLFLNHLDMLIVGNGDGVMVHKK